MLASLRPVWAEFTDPPSALHNVDGRNQLIESGVLSGDWI